MPRTLLSSSFFVNLKIRASRFGSLNFIRILKNPPQGRVLFIVGLDGLTSFHSAAQALISCADRRLPIRLSLVVEPTSRWFELS